MDEQQQAELLAPSHSPWRRRLAVAGLVVAAGLCGFGYGVAWTGDEDEGARTTEESRPAFQPSCEGGPTVDPGVL